MKGKAAGLRPNSASIRSVNSYIDGLVQERCNSSALAMELHLSYITVAYRYYFLFTRLLIFNHGHIWLEAMITILIIYQKICMKLYASAPKFCL